MTSPKPRLWFFNRSYWPDSEATGQLLTELCEDLADEFEIEVFCGRPNHIQDGEAPLLRGGQTHRGVSIHRLWHTRFAKSSRLGKLSNLLTFTLTAFGATLFRRRPDLVVTETDPFFLPLLGRWLKRRYHCAFVAWLQDVYPDIAIAVGQAREGWATRFLRTRLARAYQRADRVVVLSEDMQSRLARHGVDRERLVIVHNWADCSRIVPIKMNNAFRFDQGLEERFVVMYSGNLGLSHQLDPLIDAAQLLRDDARFAFVFIGEGVQKPALQQQAAELGLTIVRFLPYQPREHLAQSLSAADVHVVSMRPETRGCVMPSKLYGILASGTPVLSLCPPGSDVSRIVAEHGLGCALEAGGDPGAWLAAMLRELADDAYGMTCQGTRARRLAEQWFDRAGQVNQFAAVLRGALGLPPDKESPSSAGQPRRDAAGPADVPETLEVLTT